jgi:hypothetical protein
MKFLKTVRIAKVDEATHTVWGLVTSEAVDSDKEICDYQAAKASFQKWSEETLKKTTAAGQDPSLGNIRVMHQLQVGGKAIKLEFKDAEKEVWLGTEPASADVWHLLKGGFLTGYSIGGDYAWKRDEGQYTRYAPEIGEVSYVDRPSNPEASYAYVKADGSIEMRKFAKEGLAAFDVKPEDSALKLHDSIATAELQKKIADLQKQNEELLAAAAAAKKGATEMTPEELKKKAEDLEKAHAAILDHLKNMHKAAMDHHAEMCKAHGEHMAAMHEHIAKCFKAIGHEGMKAAEGDLLKVFSKADVDALIAKALKDAKAPAAPETFSKEDAEKMVKDAVEKVKTELAPKTPDNTDRVRLVLIGKDGKEVGKADQSNVAQDDEALSKSAGI